MILPLSENSRYTPRLGNRLVRLISRAGCEGQAGRPESASNRNENEILPAGSEMSHVDLVHTVGDAHRFLQVFSGHHTQVLSGVNRRMWIKAIAWRSWRWRRWNKCRGKGFSLLGPCLKPIEKPHQIRLHKGAFCTCGMNSLFSKNTCSVLPNTRSPQTSFVVSIFRTSK